MQRGERAESMQVARSGAHLRNFSAGLWCEGAGFLRMGCLKSGQVDGVGAARIARGQHWAVMGMMPWSTNRLECREIRSQPCVQMLMLGYILTGEETINSFFGRYYSDI